MGAMPQTPDDTAQDWTRAPADRGLVEALSRRGLIDAGGRRAALEVLHPHDAWGLWAARLLLGLGSALVLAGVVTFFAFNWAALAPMVKFALIGAGIAASMAAALILKPATPGGQAALVGAAVLTGVFLAVAGQVYQTGADAWTLFAVWSGLILGWTLLAGAAPLWAVWLAVTDVALVLWWDQTAPLGHEYEIWIYPLLAALNGAALAAREDLARRGIAWAAAEWTRLGPAAVVLVALLIPSVAVVLDLSLSDLESPRGQATAVAGLAGLIGTAAVYAVSRWRLRDRWMLAGSVLILALVAEAALVRLLKLDDRIGDAAVYLVLGVLTLGVFSAAVIHLRTVLHATPAEDEEAEP